MGLLSIYGRRILWAASTGSVLFGRGKEIHLKLVGLYIGFRNPISVFTLLLSVESSLSNQQPLSPTILLKQLALACSMAFSLTPGVFCSPMSTLLMGHKPRPSSTVIHPRVHCKCFHVKCIASPEYPNNLQILVCLQLWTYIVWRML